MKELRKVPSSPQLVVLQNLRFLLKAYGSCEDDFLIPSSGRRCTSLVSQLVDLCKFLIWQGLSNDSYMHDFPGAGGGLDEVKIQPDLNREEFRSYRNLDLSRLKITGIASWDPSPFLCDSLWLTYGEPESLRWNQCPIGDKRDLGKEKYEEVLRLAKSWDVNGLLWLGAHDPERDITCMRFFNCFKNSSADRMIGDRRVRNSIEGTIPDASRFLPTIMMLLVLEVCSFSNRLSICVLDRKDFYYQFAVASQRAISNMYFPNLGM